MPTRPPTHKHKQLTKRHEVASGEEWRKGKTAAQRGYSYKWQKARAGFLRHNPLCVHCQTNNRLTLAKVVDHIIDHKGDKGLFWDRDNWQPLCTRCHNIKTAKT